MRPNFALTLSFDGIGLLQRAFPGWKLVGEVALDTDDLSEALRDLREDAIQLDPAGLRTKLVLPIEQLKYLSIGIADDPESAVRAALDGSTPYAVDDLAYDWVAHEGQIQVAAVARETLAEAESFALEHGFNPVSFVSRPTNGEFAGEPFFGATQHALAQGHAVEEIDRDVAPIRIIGAATAPAPDAAAPSPKSEPESEPESDNEPEIEDQLDAAFAAEAAEAAELSDGPETQVDAPPVAFSSIRASRDAARGGAPARLDGVTRDISAPRVTLKPTQDDSLTDTAPPVTGRPSVALTPGDVTAKSSGSALEEAFDAGPAPNFESAYAEAEAAPDPDPYPVPAPKPATKPRPAPDRAVSFFSRRRRIASPALAGAAATVPPPQDERQRMTIFGAREQAQVGGKPRFLGLILTAILLVFLIGVAAWASIFLDDGLARFFREDRGPAVATAPEPEDIRPAGAEVDADAAPVESVSLRSDEPLSVLDDPATTILSRVTPQDLSPDEAMARYAATGIWQLAPGSPAQVAASEFEDFYQTTLDPEPDFGDAVSLPVAAVAVNDASLPTPSLPPAPDATFTFDQRGLVVATPDGALTPDGVRVFAGLPGVSLPAALQRGAQRPQAEPEVATPTANPQLALLRPRARPADAAEQIERGGLSGRTMSELAVLRPKLRPESAQEAAETANAGAATANPEAETVAAASTVDPAALQGAVDQALAQPDPFAGATTQAVRASLKPNTRPSNFAAVVERAEEKATQEPVRVAAAQKVTPKIPSTASVAKTATDRNALKFQRVNLIGVYGTTSNRRALVRMSNGRYQKVKVGDRLDGGRISAIGDGELRYQKGGRNIVLQMPRG